MEDLVVAERMALDVELQAVAVMGVHHVAAGLMGALGDTAVLQKVMEVEEVIVLEAVIVVVEGDLALH